MAKIVSLRHTETQNEAQLFTIIKYPIYEFIDTVNKLHNIFKLGNSMIFLNGVNASRQFEFGIDYVQ